LNPRPSGYEPDELPDCSTPREQEIISTMVVKVLSIEITLSGLRHRNNKFTKIPFFVLHLKASLKLVSLRGNHGRNT
jgi:hypothetical protein